MMNRQPYDSNQIRIIQLNCNRASNVVLTILDLAVHTADILLLQEPGIQDPDFAVTHPSFELLLPPKNNRKWQRTATYVSKNNPFLTCSPRQDLSSDPDLQILEVSTPTIPTTFIFNLYNGYESESDMWTIPRSLINTPLPTRTVLAGDFNAHHVLWNSTKTTPVRADELIHLITSQNLTIINTPDEATYISHSRAGQSQSVIDLTITTSALTDSITGWCIDHNAATGSDHNTIRFNITATDNTTAPNPQHSRLNWDKTDWEIFTKHLSQRCNDTEATWSALHGYPSPNNLDQSADFLRDLILEAADLAAPPLNICPRSKRWWTPELKDSRRKMNHAQKIWRESGADVDFTCFKSLRNQHFRNIRTAKSTQWRSFLADAQGKDIFTALRYTRPRTNQRTPVMIDKDNNSTATTFADKANLFRKALFPPPPTSPPPSSEDFQHPLPWTTFTPTEIKTAIFTSANRKAPGPDGITFLCLRHAYQAASRYFNSFYAALGETGYHPIGWRQATTVVIPKPGKPDYTIPKAHRPIALLNCMGKILEKMMATRLTYYAETYNLLHTDQIGGRQQRSAIDAALALTHEIEVARHSKLVTSVLFMDVKGAFDNVSRPRLLHTMRSLGIPTIIITWTNHFLTNRSTSLAFDGQKEPQKPIQTGIPQGSPTSPILFLLYLRPLFDTLNHQLPSVWTPSYIDDVALVVHGPSRPHNARLLEAAAKAAFTWAANNAVLFDDSKTELMHFHRQRNTTITNEELVTLPNNTIVRPGTQGGPSDVIRWIGVWFDRQLTFKHHVNLKTASGLRTLGALQRLANTEAGLSPAAVRQLYISCVVPIYTFGAEVWWNSQSNYCQHLQTIQNRAARHILGAFKTTPARALQNEAVLTPIKAHLNHLHRQYAIRTLSMPTTHPIRLRLPSTFPPFNEETFDEETETKWNEWDRPPQPHKKYKSRLTRILFTINQWINRTSDIESFSITNCPPWVTIPATFHIANETKEDMAIIHNDHYNKLAQDTHNIICYTDGSMLHGIVGAGLAIETSESAPAEYSFPMGNQSEVYDAELLGIAAATEHALKHCQTHHLYRRHIHIFTDNQASIQRASHLRPRPGQELAIRILKATTALRDLQCKTTVQWVPGHTEISGNDRADRLAKTAAQDPNQPAHPKTTIPYLKRRSKAARKSEWASIWDSYTSTGTHYEGSLRFKPDIHFASNNRQLISTITQLRTGHGYFNSYLHRIPTTNTKTSKCSCNQGGDQTPTHLLLHCPLYSKARQRLFDDEDNRTKNPRLRIDLLLHTNIGWYALQRFLTTTRIATRKWYLKHHPDLPQPNNTHQQHIGWGDLDHTTTTRPIQSPPHHVSTIDTATNQARE
jgi:ribonuclease HI